jgi:hypothetical protein
MPKQQATDIPTRAEIKAYYNSTEFPQTESDWKVWNFLFKTSGAYKRRREDQGYKDDRDMVSEYINQ